MQINTSKYKGNKVYNLKFYNLGELYYYLKNNPPVNEKVFPVLCSTQVGRRDFYGAPLPEAIEYLKDGYTEGLNNFLRMNSYLSNIGNVESNGVRSELAVYGGVAIPALVAQGIPECMLRSEAEDTRVVNVLFNLSYPGTTSDEQIKNRGLAVLYIIQTLEAKGYLVNFKAFELSKNDREMFHLSIDLKNPGEEFLDVKKCYYPMVGKEFLRRILFRIMESTPLQEETWRIGYGEPCTSSEMRDFYKAGMNDLVISKPQELGIQGINIYQDTLNLIETLNIQDEFDIKELKILCNKNTQ